MDDGPVPSLALNIAKRKKEFVPADVLEYADAKLTVDETDAFVRLIARQAFDDYMVINSRPYVMAAKAQLPVTVKELPCLEHPSYIDTARLIRLDPMETVGQVEAKPSRHRGSISAELKKKILAKVAEHGVMPKDQVAKLTTNFSQEG